jgi:hypothetical protein
VIDVDYLRRLYGDRFGGFNDTPRPCAFDLTAPSMRPSFIAMTPVGVFASANA